MNKLITNLAGGMNISTNPIIIRDNEAELIVNYSLDKVGSLTCRPGYDVFASQAVASKRVLGLYQYTNTSTPAETTQVMVVNNSGDTQSVIYYNNSSTWATSKTNDTAITTVTNFNRVRFVTFLDYLFRVNGTDVTASSVDVNGSTWGTTNCPATITPSFISVFKDRVYAARNGTAKGSRFYFSSLPSAGAISWDTTNDWVDVNPDDGDEINALENNGDRLLIFKRRALYRWDYGMVEPDRLIGVGTESQESVKTNLDLGITFFANSKGVYAYTGGRPKKISRKIQPFIDAMAAADWNDVCAECDDDHYYLYLADSLTVNNVIYTNVMAVYNIPLDAWVIYCLNTPVRFMNKLILSGEEWIYFGNNQGRTYKFNSGLEDDSGGASYNTAVPVSTEFIGKEHILTFPNKTNVQRVYFISENAQSATAYYQTDRLGDFKLLTNLNSRFKASKNIGRECRSFAIKITDSGSVASRIDGYCIEHLPTKEKV